jgi:O-antigen/teichoic acid export membrane protein
MEIIAIGSGVMVFHSSIAAVLIAKGHPGTFTQLNAVFVTLLAILMFGLVPIYGAAGAAAAFSLTAVLVLPLCLYQLRRLVGMPVRAFALAVLRPVTSSVLMAVVVRSILPAYSLAMGPATALAWLLIGIATGIVTYMVVDGLLWLAAGRPPGAERIILDFTRARLSRLLP